MRSFSAQRLPILIVILVSYLMIVLDISIVITALPKIQQDLHFSTATLSWVQNAYTLVFGGLLLLGARAGDTFGRRRMFIIGLAIFTFASFLIGIAQSATWLIAARAIQGVGAAVLAPSTLALLSTNFSEGPERTLAISYYAAVAGVAASLGLVAGGVIAGWLSWRIGFFINLPIGIFLILGARKYLTETNIQSGKFDVAGAVASTLGMTALVFGLVNSAEEGWANPLTLCSIGAGLLLIMAFIFIEANVQQPIMPLRLFASRERTGAYLARLLFLGAMVGFWFFTTQLLQGVMDFSPALAGAAFLPTTLPNFIAAMVIPVLVKRMGSGRVLLTGLFFAVCGMAWLSRFTTHSSYIWGVALPMILIGIGQGLSLGPLTTFGMTNVADADAGAASGLINVAHQLGGSLGLGVLIAIFALSSSYPVTGHELLAHEISAVYTSCSIMLAIAIAVVLTLIPRTR